MRTAHRPTTCWSGGSRICSLGPVACPIHAPLVRSWSFHYQAVSWDRSRRVIAKVEHHLGELFPVIQIANPGVKIRIAEGLQCGSTLTSNAPAHICHDRSAGPHGE